MFDQKKIAVVGYGYWGAKHARVLSSLPGVALTVIDADETCLAEAEKQFPAARLVSRLDAALDDLDGVVVATPPGSHATLASQALAAGMHTLVEKPLTTSVADAESLIGIARENNALLMVGHTFEYNAAVRKLREIVRSGDLGRILYIHSSRLGLGRYQKDCDVVWDLAPHDISIISYLLDEMPTSVSAWADRNVGPRHADVAYVRLDFSEADTHAIVHVSWLDPCKVRRVTVVGDQKMAVYDDLSDNERIRVYDIGVDIALMDDYTSSPSMPVSYRTGDIVSPYLAFEEPLKVQDSHFLDCIRGVARPESPGERGLEVVRVLKAVDSAHSVTGRVSVASPLRLVPEQVAQ
ncbi:Gfo/Idh/MocA family protein [Actinomycetospora straminea]|uniref:Gfo/Idh/MocA family oxidoreductase n=1 Tax=Actinomycetospora straminea TaxID=663607 RepID=A0ABP9E6H6_9PSEU|nr:Gfo/Idh/MocA family oxidoreductase [Actinomycetospora straminea]MDD7931043.1 Gfo/Idh/MocA family oxidoreductase [Actinomycetospora straminea]